MNESVTQLFDYQGQNIRSVVIDGEPWFVAADLLALLDLSRSSVSLLDDGERGVHTMDSPSGQQNYSVVNESGAYSLIFRSRKDEAKAIKRWVTSEVLPSIRQTGSYGAPVAFDPSQLSRLDILRLAMDAEEEKKVLEAALESATPAIEYHDRYVANDDAMTVKTWAAQFGLTEPQARKMLMDKNIVYRFSIGQRWSTKKNAVVEEFEYRARAGRVTFDWFDLRPQHNAPRHHNGQVRQTLYIRQQYAIDLSKKLGLTPAPGNIVAPTDTITGHAVNHREDAA